MEATKPKLVPVPEEKRPSAEPAAAPPAPKRSAKRPFVILGGILGVAALGIGAYVIATAGQESTDDAEVEADVVPIGARVGGQVAHVAVKENQHVKKGDLILQIDDADYAARVKEKDAQLATAAAQADAADSQVQIVEANAKGGQPRAKAAGPGS